MPRILTSVAVCLAALPLLTVAAKAETKIGFRQLTTVQPVAIQRGTSAEVNLHSNFTLDGAHRVFFDRPGIEMTFAETEPKEAPRRGRGSDGTPFRFQVTVPEDQLPGVYELRVATEQAVSSVSQLLITDFPVVQEDREKDNGTIETAATVELPAAICGLVEKAEDVDHYRFTGKAGETYVMEVFAQRVTDSIHGMVVRGPLIYLMDSLLTVYGPSGQVIAQNDNAIGGDSLLSVTLPEDGEYTVQIRDSRYAGSGRYVYCLEVSQQPYVQAVVPMAVPLGQSATATVSGSNLGDAEARTAEVTLQAPADAKAGWDRTRLDTPGGPSNVVDILYSDAPQFAAAGNTTAEQAMTLPLPSGVTARFNTPSETHYYRFEAKQGAAFKFEIHSDRRDLPVDAVLQIQDGDGKRLTEVDDGDKTQDPVLYWKAPADGAFVLAVRDLHGRSGERFVYHLSAEPSGPDFELHGEYYYAQLAPGTNMIWFARIDRKHGFDGPVQIRVENLPPGVTQQPTQIPAGMSHCGIILQAAADAPIDASLVRIVGEAEVMLPSGETGTIVREGQITCEQQSSGGGQARWPINTSIVGVTKPLDLLSVAAEPSEIVLAPGGQAEITVTIERNAEFKDPVTLAMSFDYFTNKFGEQLPKGVTVGKASELRLSGDKLSGKVVLEAAKDATPVERLPIAVLARVSITFSITTNYASNPIFLTVASPQQAEGAAGQ